ncbi:MAG: hypothetical protein AAF514_06870 [Verrucomicrobiota bacterium]
MPDRPLSHETTKSLGRDRGPCFYEAALRYAGSLWLQDLPARSLLLINRALGADLKGDEPIIEEWPLPYRAIPWILVHRSDRVFIGNPRRHYQHLATRMVEPRKELRSWRAWACWYLSTVILPENAFPPDRLQIETEGISEPSGEEIGDQLERLGFPREKLLWEEACKFALTLIKQPE